MFRRIILIIISSFLITSSTSIVVACNTDLQPKILFVTSYMNAEENASSDQIIFHALQKSYGTSRVVPIYSNLDDNTYANIFQNLIPKYQINKVFINNDNFNHFFPNQQASNWKSTNLIRIIQQYSNTNFYFINSNIADELKAKVANIFEIRFNQPTDSEHKPINYGSQLAQNFYQQIVIQKAGKTVVNTDKFKFNIVSSAGHKSYQIKIGYINNIANHYESEILNQFIEELKKKSISNGIYDFEKIDIKQPSVAYNDDTWQIIESSVYSLYLNNSINFFINTNDWYNNAVAFAASKAAKARTNLTTLKFIVPNITNASLFDYNNQTNLMFGYYADANPIISKTKTGLTEADLVCPNGPNLNINSYGVNGKLNFVSES